MANPEHIARLNESVQIWNQWRADNPEVRPDMSGADLRKRDLRGANLREVDFYKANLSGSNISGTDLSEAFLSHVILDDANISHTKLYKAILVESSLIGTDLTGARIYGASVWNVKLDSESKQGGLIITRSDEAIVTVDDIEVAQFIHLLLRREKLRNVIDTITSKAVLILGRFTEERKKVLDAIREELRQRGYVPILFDFEPSANRDLTETIQLLANMAKFVIADLTDAKSIPQELSHIIPLLPSVPVQPILLASQREYAMFEHWRGFNTVLPEFLYKDGIDLIENLEVKVILPADAWRRGQNEVSTLKEEIEELKAKLAHYERG